MKIRIELIISIFALSLSFTVASAQAQRATTAPSRTEQTPTQAATAPATPSVPSAPTASSAPSTPSVSSVPGMPSAPSMPSVPSAPSVPAVPDMDPLGDVMFPPDLIMRHARELGLSNEQKSFMRGEIQSATTRFNELQWQLQDAMEVLHQKMESSPVNDQQALSQLDKVLDVEREIKRLHVGLGIRIKNQLTPEQQAKLQELRRAPLPDRPSTPRPPGSN